MAAEVDEDVCVALGDVAGGQGGDPGLLLAVEQQQAAGDSVDDVEAVVVEESGCCPALRMPLSAALWVLMVWGGGNPPGVCRGGFSWVRWLLARCPVLVDDFGDCNQAERLWIPPLERQPPL